MKLSKKLIFPVSGLVVSLLISLGPLLVTGWSHLRYGNSINYGGRSLTMPLRWYGRLEGDHIILSKLSPTVFDKIPSSTLVAFWPVRNPPKNEAEEDSAYQSFASIYWTYLASGGGETKGPFEKGSGEKKAVCMRTSVIKDKWVSVSCLVFRGTWNATFYGEPKEIDLFYQIIQGSR